MKNVIPPIQVKDLAIQKRENDLVVATFGRGYYILDDYSPLKQLSEEISKKDAHMFDITDALMYYPSSNLDDQRAVHFRAPNPDPAARFDYFIKDGYETLKQKRIKVQKKAEKDGGAYPYPTEAELLAEEEVSPNLVFTIYDLSDRVIRKIISPLKAGYQSTSWDFNYLSKRGPNVAPGKYKIALDKNENGVFSRLIEPKEFTVISLENALGYPDYAANFQFSKDVIDLNALVTAASGKIEEMNTSLRI